MQQAASPLRLYFLLHLSYHHALHGGDAVRCSKLHLHCVSTLYFTSYFLLRKKHLHKSSKPTDYLIRFLRNNCN
jgi:hypothetical protein